MPRIESWLMKHLVTVMISMISSGMIIFATTAFGFQQATIEKGATLEQSIALVDERFTTFQENSEARSMVMATDMKEIKSLLQKLLVKVAVLESKE